MMTVCESRGAQQERKAKHQGGGLPFVVHGCLQLLWGQAPFPHEIETRQARSLLAALHLAVLCLNSARERPLPVDVQITGSQPQRHRSFRLTRRSST
jgi:hypothetical protein